MGLYTELIPLIFSTLYSIRDFWLNVPLIGNAIAAIFQWIINVLPL